MIKREKSRARTILRIRDISLSEIGAQSASHAAGITPRNEQVWERFRGRTAEVYLDPRPAAKTACGAFSWEVVPGSELWLEASESFGARSFTVCEHIAECD